MEVVGGEQCVGVVPEPVLPGEGGEDGDFAGHGVAVAHDEPDGGGAGRAVELDD